MTAFEKPTETQSGNETVSRHPAYGQILLNRSYGSKVLYGSDFEQASTITLTIYRSELRRTLSHDRYDPLGRPLIKVDLSQAQWGALLSSFDRGDGTPCTLDRFNGQAMPGLPLRDTTDLYNREGAAAIKSALTSLDDLEAALLAETKSLSKGKQDSLLAKLRNARRSLNDQLPFVATANAAMEESVLKTYRREEVTLSIVTTISTLKAKNIEEAKMMFDDGCWETLQEEVGDCNHVISSDVEEVVHA